MIDILKEEGLTTLQTKIELELTMESDLPTIVVRVTRGKRKKPLAMVDVCRVVYKRVNWWLLVGGCWSMSTNASMGG